MECFITSVNLINFGRPWPSQQNTSINVFLNALALGRAVGAAVDIVMFFVNLSENAFGNFRLFFDTI